MTSTPAAPAATSATADRTGRFSPLLEARRALFWLAGAFAVYSVVMTASRGGCAGGVTLDGGFLDSAGEPTGIAPVCTNLVLGPSPMIGIVLGALFVWALGAAARQPERAAVLFSRISWIGVLVVLAAIAIGHVWFWLLPSEASGFVLLPFPFASVDISTTPMQG